MSTPPLAALTAWLTTAGKQLQFELALDNNRQCSFVLDDDLVCILEVPETQDYVIFYSPVALVPEQKESVQAFYEKALALNLFQVETHGGVLGLSPDRKYLIYSLFKELASLNESSFLEALLTFLETASTLNKTFKA